jgi:hypothetical protein
MKVDIGKGHIFEFWSQSYLGLGAGVTQFEMEPHEAKVLFITEEAPIAVVGVDDCLCPTIQQHYEADILEGRFIKKGETVYVVAKAPIQAIESCTVNPICKEQGLYAVTQIGESLSYSIK